jgi:hypothetical protein
MFTHHTVVLPVTTSNVIHVFPHTSAFTVENTCSLQLFTHQSAVLLSSYSPLYPFLPYNKPRKTQGRKEQTALCL